MKRNGGRRSRRHRASRGPGQRRLAEQAARTEGHGLADTGWVEWGGELIWPVDFTSGGAPIGLRACELEPSELRAMGLDVAGVDESWLDGSEAWLQDSALE